MTQGQRPTPADTARQLREIAAGADGECWGPWEDVSEILLEAAALLTASEREEIVLLRRACDAAFAFIEAHVGDPDITDEMRRKYADYKDAREALEGR